MEKINDILPFSLLAELEKYKDTTAKEASELKCKGENDKAGNLNDTDGYDCKICKNRGFLTVPYEKNGFYLEKQKTCDCQQIRSTIRILHESGLKDVVKRSTFDKYIADTDWRKDIKDRAIDFVKNSSENWFYIGGKARSGKTHICTAIAREFIYKRLNVRYMSWIDVSRRLKSNVADNEKYTQEINEYKNADVLYIDDLFKTNPTDADIRLAYEILNYRYNNRKLITIISSEKFLSEIIKTDCAIGGRINELTDYGKYAVNVARTDDRIYKHGTS